jgi:hypothetical protein
LNDLFSDKNAGISFSRAKVWRVLCRSDEEVFRMQSRKLLRSRASEGRLAIPQEIMLSLHPQNE